MSNIHTRAINLARKHSVRAENDLLQESFLNDDRKGVTEEYCSTLLRQLMHIDMIPQDCHNFASFRASLATQNKPSWDPIAYAGMDAREAIEAQSARENGRMSQAQILRRMSSRSKPSERSWFS